jgi:spore coat assembly protein
MNIGDLVTRDSYNNDIVFTIIDIDNDTYYLKGKNVRLYADSNKDDLVKYDNKDIEQEQVFQERLKDNKVDRNSEYFYIPGKILHIDGDNDYLKRCLDYYESLNIPAIGFTKREDEITDSIYSMLEHYQPNILVITGHDAYYKKKGDYNNNNAYKNSKKFISAVKEARRFESSHQKLIIIAGACQSNYEELIKAGANFASSPKRINIHALDPAIIAAKMSLSDINNDINLKEIIEKTKYGSRGVGGIITKGTMYTGYPR